MDYCVFAELTLEDMPILKIHFINICPKGKALNLKHSYPVYKLINILF